MFEQAIGQITGEACRGQGGRGFWRVGRGGDGSEASLHFGLACLFVHTNYRPSRVSSRSPIGNEDDPPIIPERIADFSSETYVASIACRNPKRNKGRIFLFDSGFSSFHPLDQMASSAAYPGQGGRGFWCVGGGESSRPRPAAEGTYILGRMYDSTAAEAPKLILPKRLFAFRFLTARFPA